METYKRLNRWLRVIQFSYLSAMAAFLNYLTLYLNEVGFSESKIGIIHGVGAVVMLVVQPVLGRILDRTQNFRQVVAVVLIACSAGVAATPFLGGLIWLQLVIIILLYAVIKQFGNVFDLWTYQLRAQYPQVEYGSTRGIGSVGEGIATLVLGYLIAWMGFGVMFGITVVLLCIALAAGMQLPNPPKAEKKQAAEKVKVAWHKNLIFYVASYLAMKTTVSLISTFSSLMVKNLGGGSEGFGIVIFLCGIAELPIFIMLGKWCRSDRVKLLYRICMLTGIVGSLMVSLAPNMPVFMVGRVLMTVVYAMYTILNLEYVKYNVEPKAQSQVILTIGAISSSVSYMIASPLGGYIMELGGTYTMAIAMIIIYGLAFVLHFGGFARTKKQA